MIANRNTTIINISHKWVILICFVLFQLMVTETKAQQAIKQDRESLKTFDGQQVMKLDSIDAADDGNDRITFYADEFRVVDPDDGTEYLGIGGVPQGKNDMAIYEGYNFYFWKNGGYTDFNTAFKLYRGSEVDLDDDVEKQTFRMTDGNKIHMFQYFHEDGVRNGKVQLPNLVQIEGYQNGVNNNPATLRFYDFQRYGYDHTTPMNTAEWRITLDHEIQYGALKFDYIESEHTIPALRLKKTQVTTELPLWMNKNMYLSNSDDTFEVSVESHQDSPLLEISHYIDEGNTEIFATLNEVKSSVINGLEIIRRGNADQAFLHIKPNVSGVYNWRMKASSQGETGLFVGSYDYDSQDGNTHNNLITGFVFKRNVNESRNTLKIGKKDSDKIIIKRGDLEQNSGANLYSEKDLAIGAGITNEGQGHARIIIWEDPEKPVLILENGVQDYTASNIVWNAAVQNNFSIAIEGGMLSEDLAIAEHPHWSDYVFEADYQPMPLEELEKFVRAEKHLPGIVSESEIAADGFYQVHDVINGQLKNLEEQVLHNIAQEKTIKKQAKQIMDQSDKLDQLEILVKQLSEQIQELQAQLEK